MEQESNYECECSLSEKDAAAAETVEGNLNPSGELISAVGLIHCGPFALSGCTAGCPRSSEPLFMLAPDAKYFDLAKAAGFSRCEKVAQDAMARLFIYYP